MNKRTRKVVSLLIPLAVLALACTCLPTTEGEQPPEQEETSAGETPPPTSQITPEGVSRPTKTPITLPQPPTAPSPRTPRPRPEPTESPLRVLFEDDFSNPNSGWEVGDYQGGSVGYGNGYYYVTANAPGSAMWGVAFQQFDDVIIEVDATQVRSPANNNNAYGVKCRDQAAGGGYGLMISGDGYYSIQEISSNGDWTPLVRWTSSSAIRQGNATNHITAACIGPTLSLFVNGEWLADTTDFTYTSGDIAFVAATFENASVEVHFDNIVVYGP